jgi:hypothetical protein
MHKQSPTSDTYIDLIPHPLSSTILKFEKFKSYSIEYIFEEKINSKIYKIILSYFLLNNQNLSKREVKLLFEVLLSNNSVSTLSNYKEYRVIINIIKDIDLLLNNRTHNEERIFFKYYSIYNDKSRSNEIYNKIVDKITEGQYDRAKKMIKKYQHNHLNNEQVQEINKKLNDF